MFTSEQSGDVGIWRCANSLRKGLRTWIVVLGLAGMASATPATAQEKSGNYGLGRTATDVEIRAWNSDIAPTGEGLPPGRGTVQEGRQVFAQKCANCHGQTGIEGPMDRLVGGHGTLKTDQPMKTVGSYWPYATTLYDYIRRAMPFTAPQSLTPDEVYSVVAWLLYQNKIIPEDAVMDSSTLPAVQMPNRHGFVPDPRPDVPKR